jgi:hypothetical protein
MEYLKIQHKIDGSLKANKKQKYRIIISFRIILKMYVKYFETITLKITFSVDRW